MKKTSKSKAAKKQTKNKRNRKSLAQKHGKGDLQQQNVGAEQGVLTDKDKAQVASLQTSKQVTKASSEKGKVGTKAQRKARGTKQKKTTTVASSTAVSISTPASKPTRRNLSSTTTKAPQQDKKTHKLSGNKAAFLCFLGVFACMLFLEASRFKIYFDGESGKYPFLRPVGEFLSSAAERSGIQKIMDTVSDFTRDVSQEYTIVADKPFEEQWANISAFYADILGLEKESTSTVAESSAQKKESIPSDTDVQEGAQKEHSAQGEVEETSSEKTLAATEQKIAQEKDTQESAVAVEEKALTPDAKPQEPEPVYAFYDASRLSPAPSAQGIEEYLTKLPDYGKKVKVLIIGDSMMMEGLGPTLQKTLRKRPDLTVIREGRYSSGLSKPDFFNWPENLKRLSQKHKPDLIIISLGANDTQDIMIGKRRFRIDTEGWERVYAIRVINFLELATEDDRKVLWVSLPVMGRMPYANRTKLINSITADMSGFYPGVAYENIEHLLTENGKYTSFIRDKNNKTIRLRSKDKIHVSTAGGQILTNYLLPYADERVGVIRMEEVNGNPYIPVAGKANTVRFSSESCQKTMEYVAYLPQPKLTTAEATAETTEKQAVSLPASSALTSSVPSSVVAVQSLSAKSQKGRASVSVEKLVAYSLQSTPSLHAETEDTSRIKVDPAQELFPVLYLLHGATGHAAQWNEHMGKELQRIADEKRVIIIAPDAEDFGWYVDSPKVSQSQIESFIIKELVPHVDLLFPTNGKRAIAGLSMGGHGAMTLGFKHAGIFSSVASVSGVLDIRLHPEQWKIRDVLGEYSAHKNEWSKHSAVYLFEKSKLNKAPKHILISTGLQDAAVLEDNQKARDVLTKKKYTFEYTELEGGHDWAFWVQEIPKHLRRQADFLHQNK